MFLELIGQTVTKKGKSMLTKAHIRKFLKSTPVVAEWNGSFKKAEVTVKCNKVHATLYVYGTHESLAKYCGTMGVAPPELFIGTEYSKRKYPVDAELQPLIERMETMVEYTEAEADQSVKLMQTTVRAFKKLMGY